MERRFDEVSTLVPVDVSREMLPTFAELPLKSYESHHKLKPVTIRENSTNPNQSPEDLRYLLEAGHFRTSKHLRSNMHPSNDVYGRKSPDRPIYIWNHQKPEYTRPKSTDRNMSPPRCRQPVVTDLRENITRRKSMQDNEEFQQEWNFPTSVNDDYANKFTRMVLATAATVRRQESSEIGNASPRMFPGDQSRTHPTFLRRNEDEVSLKSPRENFHGQLFSGDMQSHSLENMQRDGNMHFTDEAYSYSRPIARKDSFHEDRSGHRDLRNFSEDTYAYLHGKITETKFDAYHQTAPNIPGLYSRRETSDYLHTDDYRKKFEKVRAFSRSQHVSDGEHPDNMTSYDTLSHEKPRIHQLPVASQFFPRAEKDSLQTLAHESRPIARERSIPYARTSLDIENSSAGTRLEYNEIQDQNRSIHESFRQMPSHDGKNEDFNQLQPQEFLHPKVHSDEPRKLSDSHILSTGDTFSEPTEYYENIKDPRLSRYMEIAGLSDRFPSTRHISAGDTRIRKEPSIYDNLYDSGFVSQSKSFEHFDNFWNKSSVDRDINSDASYRNPNLTSNMQPHLDEREAQHTPMYGIPHAPSPPYIPQGGFGRVAHSSPRSFTSDSPMEYGHQTDNVEISHLEDMSSTWRSLSRHVPRQYSRSLSNGKQAGYDMQRSPPKSPYLSEDRRYSTRASRSLSPELAGKNVYLPGSRSDGSRIHRTLRDKSRSPKDSINRRTMRVPSPPNISLRSRHRSPARSKDRSRQSPERRFKRVSPERRFKRVSPGRRFNRVSRNSFDYRRSKSPVRNRKNVRSSSMEKDKRSPRKSIPPHVKTYDRNSVRNTRYRWIKPTLSPKPTEAEKSLQRERLQASNRSTSPNRKRRYEPHSNFRSRSPIKNSTHIIAPKRPYPALNSYKPDIIKKPNKEVPCDICEIFLNSMKQLESHCLSKKHKRIEAEKMSNAELQPKKPKVIGSKSETAPTNTDKESKTKPTNQKAKNSQTGTQVSKTAPTNTDKESKTKPTSQIVKNSPTRTHQTDPETTTDNFDNIVAPW